MRKLMLMKVPESVEMKSVRVKTTIVIPRTVDARQKESE
jgi:hypothetical protein